MSSGLLLKVLLAAASSQDALAGANTLLVSFRHNGRRLGTDQTQHVASQSSLPGHQCAVNISALNMLHAQTIDTAPGCDREKLCKELLSHSEVETCEPDYKVYLDVDVAVPAYPSDPDYCKQWHLTKIDIAGAWRYSKGTGAHVVGVLDSGADMTHPDLVGSLYTNNQDSNGDGQDSDFNGRIDDKSGWDALDGDNTPNDLTGHGTHVAGLVGATRDNAVGVSGVSKAPLLILKFISDTAAGGDISAAQGLLEYSAGQGSKIAQMSFGSFQASANTKAVFEYAQTHSVIMIISAGNDGNDNDVKPYYPCSYDLDNIICVGASDQNDVKAYFSNYGKTTVDIFAPGHQIYSTGRVTEDGGYKILSGTSQAAPITSGVVALVWDMKPTLTYKQVIAIVVFTADVVDGLTPYVKCGRLNAKKAMQAAAQGFVPTACGQKIPDKVGAVSIVAPECATQVAAASMPSRSLVVILAAFLVHFSGFLA